MSSIEKVCVMMYCNQNDTLRQYLMEGIFKSLFHYKMFPTKILFFSTFITIYCHKESRHILVLFIWPQTVGILWCEKDALKKCSVMFPKKRWQTSATKTYNRSITYLICFYISYFQFEACIRFYYYYILFIF